MSDRIDTFFDRLKGRSVAFCGMGITNTPLAEMFLRRGFKVTVCDREPLDGREGLERIAQLGAIMRSGCDCMKDLDADIIFRTPGMRFTSPELEEYRSRGVVVTSELEIFFELCPARIIAVTGSSGKTTTASIIADALQRSGSKVWLGGNIGRALMPDIEKMAPDDWVVCELSSFQLISMRCSPDIAVITNITPNHLDMHRDMDEYIAAKRNIFTHQSAFGRLIINADCPTVGSFAGEQRGACLSFSRRQQPHWGAYADRSSDIFFSDRGKSRRIMNISEIRVGGMHNVENYLAAICALDGLVSDEVIRETAHLFRGVEHRAEFVRCLDGVTWYNDSIATTPSRTIGGTLSMCDGQIILIAGGYDKKIPFDELGQVLCRKVKTLILMGDTADKIESAVRGCREYIGCGIEIFRVQSMDEAVRLAAGKAVSGDIVSLSPACAAFGMYQNFEERGRHYKQLVHELKAFSRHSRTDSANESD